MCIFVFFCVLFAGLNGLGLGTAGLDYLQTVQESKHVLTFLIIIGLTQLLLIIDMMNPSDHTCMYGIVCFALLKVKLSCLKSMCHF